MDSYPAPARALVEDMTSIAAADPARAVAFQGAPGANSHLAAMQYAPDGLALPCFSFEDALDAVRDGAAARAIIPIENSLHGRVADIHFLLPESGLHIVAEHFLRVRHCLLGHADERVREALSHPQALGQCRKWLRAEGIRAVAYADTAGAAALLAERPQAGVAAIAPRLAAELYGLHVHAEGIEDADRNVTRFVVLAREAAPVPPDVPAMTSFVFEVKSVPAALYKAMGGFATNGVNLTKLESYLHGEYFAAAQFFVDIEGAPGNPAVDRALAELQFHTEWVRMLGSYPRAEARG